jgi:hypothetical protein
MLFRCGVAIGNRIETKKPRGYYPRFFSGEELTQSDLGVDAGFALEAFSLEAAGLLSEVDALFSVVDFAPSPEAVPLVPLLALEVSAGGGVLFFA